MIAPTPFLVLNQPWEQVIIQVSRRLAEVGLSAVRTFDLRDARQAHGDCTCPHHGTDQCDCQMIIFLVYGGDQPLSLVARGCDGQTWLALVDTPQQRADPRLGRIIQTSLAQPTGLP